jgi:hypothetical protein
MLFNARGFTKLEYGFTELHIEIFMWHTLR